MLSIQRGLKDEGVWVSLTKLCQWFGVARRKTYYKPTSSPAKVKPDLAEPIKEMGDDRSGAKFRLSHGCCAAWHE